MHALTKHYPHILLADDDLDDCLLFREALDELQVESELTTVANGDQLMQLLSETDTLPSILFLDMNMPRKDGMHCLTEMKASARLKNIPVIIYSTSYRRDVIDSLYSGGALFYIRKPNGFPELKRAIHDVLINAVELESTQPSKEGFVLSHAIQ